MPNVVPHKCQENPLTFFVSFLASRLDRHFISYRTFSNEIACCNKLYCNLNINQSEKYSEFNVYKNVLYAMKFCKATDFHMLYHKTRSLNKWNWLF